MEYNITGTTIWYYYVCKREVWLISHGIESDQEDDNIKIGKTLHERSYKRDYKEIHLDNSRIDMVRNSKNQTVVIEIKKSSKTDYAAKMQLLYYIYQIDPDNTGNIKGELRFPSERKIEKIELNEKNIEELENTIEDIKRIINLNNVQPIKSYHCKNCAYSEFCWS